MIEWIRMSRLSMKKFDWTVKVKAVLGGRTRLFAPAPCTLHLEPCTLHPEPCILHPAPCTLHPAPCTLHPAP